MINELYQEVLLDHYKKPRFKTIPEGYTLCQEGENPSCGDFIQLYCTISKNDRLQCHFQGHGCSVSQASASILCQTLHNKPKDECLDLLIKAQALIKNGSDEEDSDIAALSGVRQFPIRIKCAILPWKTLELCLSQSSKDSSQSFSHKPHLKVVIS